MRSNCLWVRYSLMEACYSDFQIYNESYRRKKLGEGWSTVYRTFRETYKRSGWGSKGIYCLTKTAEEGI